MELPKTFSLIQIPCSILFLFTLFFFMNSMCLETRPIFSNETDRQSLLAFKDGIEPDPNGILTSWNVSIHHCDWIGVKCGRKHRRVTVLDLHSQSLVGMVSPYIGNLTFLRILRLLNNSFHGEIPREVTNLLRLQYFILSGNLFGGEIQANMSRCSELLRISISNNNLVGTLPAELGSLSKLLSLTINHNDLAGHIPSSYGNLSSLQFLSLTQNRLVGNIPGDLGRLKILYTLSLGGNRLTGMIPLSIYNLSSLETFTVEDNQYLYGNIPPDVGLTLPNLQIFSVGNNQFTGLIPVSLSNASGLQALQVTGNNFSGPVFPTLGVLQGLLEIGLADNHLGTRETDDLNFLSSLTNCSSLEMLQIGGNNFGGILPNSVANLSIQLSWFGSYGNYISGRIPTGLENLRNLDVLVMDHNLLTGDIPSGIGSLRNLAIFFLNDNRLSGPIPSSFGNLTSLIRLTLGNNRLQGTIPSSLQNLQNLQIFDLAHNNLTGPIPGLALSLPSLSILLDLSHNSFSGSLPLEVGKLKHLSTLILTNNNLSGMIPSSLGNCESLEFLYLDSNLFEGTIPEFLGMLPLQVLNLSFNNFEGEVPRKGIFGNTSGISVIGNKRLCGGIPKLRLTACVVSPSNKRRSFVPRKLIIIVILGIFCLVVVTCFFLLYYQTRISRKKPASTSSPDYQQLRRISYAELLKATNGFSSDNLVGMGSYGSVYKGALTDGEGFFAVKVFNLQERGASNSFLAECNALRNIKHRNLIKILSVCSSVDFKGNDFKALVFEFMANGSLDDWLHPEVDGQGELKSLNLKHRLDIAIDVASALDYLHHDCEPSIVHRDMKPSNVLIDDDMCARVGDFGLAKFLFSSVSNDFNQIQTSSEAIKGSIGFIAPEYAVNGQASIQGDVYSYGILLLEIITGKRPTNDMFQDGLNLHNFAVMALPEQVQVMKIIDPLLLSDEQHYEGVTTASGQRDKKVGILECLVSVLKIGITCSAESPGERMNIRNVMMELSRIRDNFLEVGIHRER